MVVLMNKERYWSPYIAGAGIGLCLLSAFYIIGKGLGASSAFSLGCAVALRSVAPDHASTLQYFAPSLAATSPLRDWIVFELLGVFAGGLTGVLLARGFRLRIDRGSSTSSALRLFAAFGGGMLISFAGRLARGCTSGVALSGGAQLALSGWLFVIAMFIGGFITAAIFRRLWA